jgi:hypothetical protein
MKIVKIVININLTESGVVVRFVGVCITPRNQSEIENGDEIIIENFSKIFDYEGRTICAQRVIVK